MSAYFSSDDIAQIGTPPANAPVGALRVSGPNAFGIVRRLTVGLEDIGEGRSGRFLRDCRFLLPLKTVGSYRHNAAGETGRTVFSCPARVLIMPAPASYTTEDVVEIHLPGSVALLNAALSALVQAGARAALPGEFTFRAFRGGRVSLRQAEAVEEVIRADSDAEKRRALARLGDRQQSGIVLWRDRLLDCAAQIEAALDFADEDLDAGVTSGIGAIVSELDAAAGSLVAGTRDDVPGIPDVALVGLANAGKSSLMNALLGDDAVLVSSAPSTTRDSIRREVVWDGIRCFLSDNPGYDPHTTGAGGLAAARAFERIGSHDLLVWVVDASVPFGPEMDVFAGSVAGGVVVVLNKSDHAAAVDATDVRMLADRHGLAVSSVVSVSARSGDGVDGLRRVLAGLAASLVVAGPWSRREIWELAAARDCCRAALEEMEGAGRLELAAEDIRRAMRAFSRALGEGYAEEALGRIFSRFCIGK